MNIYRICENEYGYFKIQAKYVEKVYKNFYMNVVGTSICFITLPVLLFMHAFDLKIINKIESLYDNTFCKDVYYWCDEYHLGKFNSKEKAEKCIRDAVNEYEENKKMNNNNWKCSGEY